jgi:hypothetical protein
MPWRQPGSSFLGAIPACSFLGDRRDTPGRVAGIQAKATCTKGRHLQQAADQFHADGASQAHCREWQTHCSDIAHGGSGRRKLAWFDKSRCAPFA